ncbi:hypothetical protein EJN90_02760 [Jeotgalibaca ciconiae]|uniref:Prepilin-type N-terminal cleavage/methylation domain-containing protein n=2 Tax=Jeotgalibaca ciconiae TaxID=2496265 RepID=A0A3Q9BJD7_9LACT|nr:hypothetical protein EJN90_02760 [Jeotgalibaca ciconiae]
MLEIDLVEEEGMTLVELLASLTLLSVVILLVGSIHIFGQKQYVKQASEASQANELSAGLSSMSRELRGLSADKVAIEEGAIYVDGTILFELVGNQIISKGTAIIAENIERFGCEKSEDGSSIELTLMGENLEEYVTMIYFRGE